MFTLTLLAGLGAQEKTNCTSMCADDPRLLKICRHVSTVQYSTAVQYSTVQYLQTAQYRQVRHFSRGETVLRLNTVLRAVSGNPREGASFKLDKQTRRRKKQWYTEDDFSKSAHLNFVIFGRILSFIVF